MISGDIPIARFGHTLNLVNKTSAILFGGATGDAGRYDINNDTYVLDIPLARWRKVEPKGAVPSKRAAHSATTVETN